MVGIFMSINEATLQAYLSTLSTAKAEEFKKLSPEEQKKKLKYGSDEAAINAYINILHKGKTISANDYEATKLTLEQLIKDCK